MSAQVEESRDYFWIYVGIATIALVGAVVVAKVSENEKYDPIRQQLDQEAAQMHIKVLKDY